MLSCTKAISVIDSHTSGEGTRLVTAGLPAILGRSMAEKMAYATRHLAWAPRFLLREPRGHKDLFGAVLTPPCDPAADAGVIFMDNVGYEPMCGHGVIGVVTSLLATGTIVPLVEPVSEVVLDTPAGLVRAYATIENQRVVSVGFDNVPSFVYRRNVTLDVPGFGHLSADVAFGGNFFALVDARQINIPLEPTDADRLADLGMRILTTVNRSLTVRHPELPHINRIIDMRFYVTPGRQGADSRNVVVLGDHMVDRSPCGTGTCAELALHHALGDIEIGQPWVTESIIGTRFVGEIVSETQVGHGADAIPAIIPRVTGRAHITGMLQLLLDPADPFPEGFLLGGTDVFFGPCHRAA